jgi:catalase
MATRKPRTTPSRTRNGDTESPAEQIGSVLSTIGGPSTAALDADAARRIAPDSAQRLAVKQAGANRMASAQPFNALKAGEYGLDAGHAPQAGTAVEPDNEGDTASTVTERTASAKLGDGTPRPGLNPNNGPLDRVRVDSGGQRLTTSFGTPIADNQNSLKAGLRGPALLEDFVLRDKITHFDHERIPERVVHARGSAAHGYFESYADLSKLTMAAPFAAKAKRTPVFVRFSTVAGERGSSDLARDVRGFAVKFYTDQGNWDLVGNNMPVFFIQDAMKFPDLVHAVKPEPHNGMPQAASAHDTFWDFAGLMPEITHMLMWVMSDRAIPRSLRMMQGFGVHTFRLVNAKGESSFCKFHWNPVAGTHSVLWDEAVKISGADSDFHRRDLWEAIEAGAYPEWELALQVFSEQQADSFSFDVLDATKLIPEELVPLQPVGRMVLNRNPDNFFAETEQVAFCTQHVVPGIDFSNDPLLQGRNFSYHDTQLTRLGGPNFNALPINAPISPVHNNQRDGLQRSAIARGRVSYEPNSLGGGCPFQAGMQGFVPFPQPMKEDKVRGKPEKFAEHYNQARLFFRSQSAVEQQHIIAAFRFELTRVQTPAIRERIVSMLANVDPQLAQGVADGLGIEVPPPMPKVLDLEVRPEVELSPALSLASRPGDGSVRTRRVALLVADGIDGDSLRAVHAALVEAEAVPRFVGARLGTVAPASGAPIHVELTLETAPPVLWDAVVVADGQAPPTDGSADPVLDFIKAQYRHCKPMLALGASGRAWLDAAGIPKQLPDGRADPGLVIEPTAQAAQAVTRFIAALARHRHFEREGDPLPPKAPRNDTRTR